MTTAKAQRSSRCSDFRLTLDGEIVEELDMRLGYLA